MKIDRYILKNFVPDNIWNYFRCRMICRDHARAVKAIAPYFDRYFKDGFRLSDEVVPLKPELAGRKIIWQYWAQGYENVPETVKLCLDSVERYCGDYTVIRIDDNSFGEYISFPEWILAKRGGSFSIAAFSDLLRLALLNAYGGLWMDATILLSGPIPPEAGMYDSFFYRRDSEEDNKRYWKNTYAYYFGWDKRFRVTTLSSFLSARRESRFIAAALDILMAIWKDEDWYPHYFTVQLIFDMLLRSPQMGPECPIVSDCTPHLLMQYINDPGFRLATLPEIFQKAHVHKLTHKDIDIAKLKKAINQY